MKFVVYDPVTKEIACTYDELNDELDCFGRFDIKEYVDGVIPSVDVYDDGTTLLIDNTVILMPKYFDDNEYDKEEEND